MMKIKDLVESQKVESTADLPEGAPKGIYVGVRFSEKSKDDLMGLIESLSIENPIPREDLHCTVIYSETPVPELVGAAQTFDPPIIANVDNFTFFKSESDKNCLVLLINCEELVKRHESIIADYGTVYTFEHYRPHITLSYDSNDEELLSKDPKQHLKTVEIISEYGKEIDSDW